MWRELIARGVDVRRALHRRPEPAWQEHDTAACIRARLDELGVAWRACADTGTVAELAPDAAGRCVALRGDIDALTIDEAGDVDWASEVDGCMHACGHDGHTATLLTTAAWLKAHEDALPGRVVLLFQPAEEGGHGALHMIEHGALDGVDAVYGWHNWPGLPEGCAVCPDGPVMAANGTFHIRVRGEGGHGSRPEACRDVVLAGAAMVTALQQIVARRLPPQRAAVLSVTGFEARGTLTTLPGEAELSGSIRIGDDALRDRVNALIAEIVQGIADAHGVRADVETAPRYGATVNTPAEAGHVRDLLVHALDMDVAPAGFDVPVMASEDFSYYLGTVPGAFALLGSGDGPSLHHARYDFNDALLPVAARLQVLLAGGPDPGAAPARRAA